MADADAVFIAAQSVIERRVTFTGEFYRDATPQAPLYLLSREELGQLSRVTPADTIKTILTLLLTFKGARYVSKHSSMIVNGNKLRNVYTGCRLNDDGEHDG